MVVTLLRFHSSRSVSDDDHDPYHESTAAPACLLLAFELSERTWKLGFTIGRGQRPRVRQIPAGAVDRLAEEIARAKSRFGLPADAPVMSCYEAGREGFWLHRYLVAHGDTNYVVDSSSIEVNRRARRAKTDGLDLAGLLSCSSATRRASGGCGTWCACRASRRKMRGTCIGCAKRSSRSGRG